MLSFRSCGASSESSHWAQQDKVLKPLPSDSPSPDQDHRFGRNPHAYELSTFGALDDLNHRCSSAGSGRLAEHYQPSTLTTAHTTSHGSFSRNEPCLVCKLIIYMLFLI
jgi:hypothetical protein